MNTNQNLYSMLLYRGIMNIKDWEGLEVIAYPIGNNARFNKNTKKFIIEKVARVFLNLKNPDGNTHYNKYRISEYNSNTKCIQINSECNSGWLLFKSLDDYTLWEEQQSLSSDIIEYFRHYYGGINMTVEDLRLIKDILNKYPR